VFTARYGLSPYIKQTRLALKGLNMQMISCVNGSFVLATNRMTNDVFRVI
jgi:hypothetical protein